MTKPTQRKKGDKLLVVLLAPIVAIVFIVGWSFYFIGQANHPKTRQPQKPINKTSTDQNEIELIVIPQQDKIIAN
jgi:flagellar basal body-associated protein FliL